MNSFPGFRRPFRGVQGGRGTNPTYKNKKWIERETFKKSNSVVTKLKNS